MTKEQIGTNAGIVWQMVNSKGCLTIDELQYETLLDDVSLAAAIGWLARENKINLIENFGITSVCLYQENYF